MVSPWACGNRLVLGQVRVDEKTNEMKVIPQLLALLDLKGCIVTVDAMSTHREIAEEVHARGADYVLPLKDNQPNLREAVEEYFVMAEEDEEKLQVPGAAASAASTASAGSELVARTQTVDVEHGRTEIREYAITGDVAWLPGVTGKPLWPGVRSIGMVRCRRIVGDKESIFVRYYLSSLPPDVHKFARAVRSHWCIENQLHWVLDVAFDEDNNRSRTGNLAHNLAILHHIALNLVKQERTLKVGVKNRRLNAGWDDSYLAKILFS
jgi:predicted transposase YbfD/YdcC